MSANRQKNDRHKQKTVSFRLPEALMGQFRLLAARNRRTLSAEAQLALENRLAAEGLWPPADAHPTDDKRRRS